MVFQTWLISSPMHFLQTVAAISICPHPHNSLGFSVPLLGSPAPPLIPTSPSLDPETLTHLPGYRSGSC